jgi:parallel beta-helix repeat protein
MVIVLLFHIAFPASFTTVMAEETIIIRYDGSIYPKDAPIARNGSLYVLTSSIQSSIIVEKSSITIDGKDFVIKGQGLFQSKGITLNRMFNVTIKNIVIEGFYYGVWISEAYNNTILNNTLRMNTGRAIWLGHSNNNIITKNKLIENKGRGIMLENSNANIIENNSIIGNGCDPIIVSHSHGNRIGRNFVVKNNGRGIWLGYSCNNTLTENEIAENNYSGIQLYYSNSNLIFGNIVFKNNIYGIQLSNSSLNHIYNNNFINNTIPLQVDLLINYWDNGFLDGGNYWSHINNSKDSYSGIMQNINGSDGLVDEPYIINVNNADHYPSVGLFFNFRIFDCSVRVVSNNQIQRLIIDVNKTIIIYLSVSYSEKTTSIFRLLIPHKLLSPPYEIKVNGKSIEYNTLFENKSLSVLYFQSFSPTSNVIILSEITLQFIIWMTLYTLTVVLLIFRRILK